MRTKYQGDARAEEERRRERLAALRTRDGVVDLEEWREARRAAAFLASLYYAPPWLAGIGVGLAPDVGCELRVTISIDTPLIRRCVPTTVNDIPVRVVVGKASGSAPRRG